MFSKFPKGFFPFTKQASVNYFTLDGFSEWVRKNKEKFREQYGWSVFTGASGYIRQWSYYEADLEVLSPTTAKVHFYDMADSFSGGRGNFMHSVDVSISEFDFSNIITLEATRIVFELQEKREKEREELRRQKERDEIMKELFGFKK